MDSAPTKIFITGGCGFLGRALISRWYDKYDIVVYSRDESKHFKVRQKYPNVKFIVGDIADRQALIEASVGCKYAVFAASMKHIDACRDNPERAMESILIGAFNSRAAAIKNKIHSSVFISTDKSMDPSTIYGAMKLAAAESFIANSNHTNVKLNCLTYGNVFDSTSSIIPKLNEIAKTTKRANIFGTEMTRFGISAEDAVTMAEEALFNDYNGVTLIPKLWSYRVLDLFQIYWEKFGVRYDIGSPRAGEKQHEILISKNFIHNIIYSNDKYWVVDPDQLNEKPPITDEFSSKDQAISKEKLQSFLEKNNFFINGG